MRKYLYDILLKNNYKVYSQGQINAPVDYPYIVVLMGTDDIILGNSVGLYQNVELLCYVPNTSVFQLDTMIENIKEILKTAKIANEFNGIAREYHDTELGAYMRNIKFKIPHSEI